MLKRIEKEDALRARAVLEGMIEALNGVMKEMDAKYYQTGRKMYTESEVSEMIDSTAQHGIFITRYEQDKLLQIIMEK